MNVDDHRRPSRGRNVICPRRTSGEHEQAAEEAAVERDLQRARGRVVQPEAERLAEQPHEHAAEAPQHGGEDEARPGARRRTGPRRTPSPPQAAQERTRERRAVVDYVARTAGRRSADGGCELRRAGGLRASDSGDAERRRPDEQSRRGPPAASRRATSGHGRAGAAAAIRRGGRRGAGVRATRSAGSARARRPGGGAKRSGRRVGRGGRVVAGIVGRLARARTRDRRREAGRLERLGELARAPGTARAGRTRASPR